MLFICRDGSIRLIIISVYMSWPNPVHFLNYIIVHCLAKELSPDLRFAYCLSLRGCLVRHAKWLWLCFNFHCFLPITNTYTHLYLPLLYPFARQAVRWGLFIIFRVYHGLKCPGRKTAFYRLHLPDLTSIADDRWLISRHWYGFIICTWHLCVLKFSTCLLTQCLNLEIAFIFRVVARERFFLNGCVSSNDVLEKNWPWCRIYQNFFLHQLEFSLECAYPPYFLFWPGLCPCPQILYDKAYRSKS